MSQRTPEHEQALIALHRAETEIRAVLGQKREGATSLGDELRMWAEEVRAEERESCAALIEAEGCTFGGSCAERHAAAIRARGQEVPHAG